MISWAVEFVTKNIIAILVVIFMATPLAAAIPPAVRLLVVSVVFVTTGAKAERGFYEDGVVRVPVEMFLHFAVGMFQRRDLVNPVSATLVAFSNLLPLPLPLVTVTALHVLIVNRDWVAAISGGVAHRGGLVGVLLYHAANSRYLRTLGRHMAMKAESEAIEQLPESHPWFDPPIADLLEDLMVLRHHSADFVTATLRAFLQASHEKRARKYRRVAHVRKGDFRSLKNYFLYPSEYHRLMPHLQSMSPGQRRALRHNMPTILTRMEGDYGPILRAFQKVGYVGDLASRV